VTPYLFLLFLRQYLASTFSNEIRKFIKKTKTQQLQADKFKAPSLASTGDRRGNSDYKPLRHAFTPLLVKARSTSLLLGLMLGRTNDSETPMSQLILDRLRHSAQV